MHGRDAGLHGTWDDDRTHAELHWKGEMKGLDGERGINIVWIFTWNRVDLWEFTWNNISLWACWTGIRRVGDGSHPVLFRLWRGELLHRQVGLKCKRNGSDILMIGFCLSFNSVLSMMNTSSRYTIRSRTNLWRFLRCKQTCITTVAWVFSTREENCVFLFVMRRKISYFVKVSHGKRLIGTEILDRFTRIIWVNIIKSTQWSIIHRFVCLFCDLWWCHSLICYMSPFHLHQNSLKLITRQSRWKIQYATYNISKNVWCEKCPHTSKQYVYL